MRGIWTALVTPFDSNTEELDLNAYRHLLQIQKAAKVTGVIPCGTTGESPTLSLEERKTLILTALEELKGSGVQVFAGTGTNHTRESVELSVWAAEQGVDGIMLVTPYYNKPSPAGLENHFATIAQAARCEVMLYNVPGRTGVQLGVSTLLNLARNPKLSNIKSLKEATGNVAFTSEILDALAQANLSLDILSGDDATFLSLLAVGATGVVSVSSNLIPEAMVQIYDLAASNQFHQARQIFQRYYPIFRDLFIESNPVPVKYALERSGRCRSEVRGPLSRLSAQTQSTLETCLIRCGIQRRTLD